MIQRSKLIQAARTRVGDTASVTFPDGDMAIFVEDAVAAYSRFVPLSLHVKLALVKDQVTYPAPPGLLDLDEVVAWGNPSPWTDEEASLRYAGWGYPYGDPFAYAHPNAHPGHRVDDQYYQYFLDFDPKTPPSVALEWDDTAKANVVRVSPPPKADSSLTLGYTRLHEPDTDGNYPTISDAHRVLLVELLMAELLDAIALELEKSGDLQVGDANEDPTKSFSSMRSEADQLRAHVENVLSGAVGRRG